MDKINQAKEQALSLLKELGTGDKNKEAREWVSKIVSLIDEGSKVVPAPQPTAITPIQGTSG